MTFSVFCVLGICLYLAGCVQGKSGICAAPPQLAYANVNGLISGGYDTMVAIDQTPCSSKKNSRYRQIDGRCNHPKDYGSTMKPLKRYMRAHYQDEKGYNTPRIFSVVGNYYLPSPRHISNELFPDISRDNDLSMFTMQYGQFASHDIGVAVVPTSPNGTIKCCGIPTAQMHKECFPIPIPDDDPKFKSCMEFVRSEPVKDDNGKVVFPREQINALTSFLDSSSIYGSDTATTKKLRTQGGKGALLLTTVINGKERLPKDTSARPGCLRTNSSNSYCQISGDSRVNQQPVLGTQHLTFHLYHNFICRELAAGILKKKGQNPSSEDVDYYINNGPDDFKEIMFQEAKKIMGGIFQKVTVCDYLPFVIGRDMMTKYKLTCNSRSKYNPKVDPRLASSFLTAAYRFGHTLIPNGYLVDGKLEFFKDEFFIPDSAIEDHEKIIEGMLQTSKECQFDRNFASAISQHLFETRTGPAKAFDLTSLNIQRGRDHGIPAYIYWRKFYGLKPYTKFEDFGDDCGPILKKLYRSVEDVDLYPGGICEEALPGGAVGETFGHIIANQFADLKFGDKYYFLSQEYPEGFTDDQVDAILKISANALLCYSGKMEKIQRNTWKKISDTNPLKLCSDFDQFNVTSFIDYFFDEKIAY